MKDGKIERERKREKERDTLKGHRKIVVVIVAIWINQHRAVFLSSFFFLLRHEKLLMRV